MNKKIIILLLTSLYINIASFLTHRAYAYECGGIETTVIDCNGGINGLLRFGIQMFTGIIGVAVVGGLVYAGVLYSSAGGNADQIKKAKDMVRNIVMGMIAYSLMFAILNFIIPGGLIG